MNHLVFLDTQAGELEKILSGIKSMVVKEFNPAQPTAHPVCPGDNLYFLRDQGDSTVRVKATVVRVLSFTCKLEEDLSQPLKEMQPRLQFTEDQYNHWSAKQHFLLVEFECAQKINGINAASVQMSDPSDWITFDEINQIGEADVENEHQAF